MKFWWTLWLVACASDRTTPIDSGTEVPTDPLPPKVPPPALGTWDPADPVGLIELRPSSSFFGPVTVFWQQRESFDVRIEFRVEGGDWQTSPVYQGVSGLNRQSIIGIPTGGTAEARLVGAGEVGFTVYADTPVTTPELPPVVPTPQVVVDDPEGYAGTGRYYLTSINDRACSWCNGQYWTFIADRQGTVYWAIRSEDNRQVLYAQISTVRGDHLLWDEVTPLLGRESVLHRTYLDREIEVIPVPGHHHAILELPDGTLVWGDRLSEEGEALVELRPDTGETRTVWTCARDWTDDGCRSNALYYDAATQRYWFSFYTQRAIVEIDRATGDTVWSSDYGKATKGAPIYTFDSAETQFDWQHGVVFLDNGNLLVSTDREIDDDESVHTVLAEYAIDREASQLREVWSYDHGEDARFNGETRSYANGNRMHVLGARSIAYEVNAEGTVVWEVEYEDGKMLNRLEFFDDLWGLMAPPTYDARRDDDPQVGFPGPGRVP